MSGFRQVLLGVLAGLLSSTIIIGSLFLAMTEGNREVAFFASPTNTAGLLPTFPPRMPNRTATPAPTATLASLVLEVTQTQNPSPTTTPSASPTAIPSLSPTTCLPPEGWRTIVTQPGDTLEQLAQAFNTSPQALQTANCLISYDLEPGVQIYVPALPATEPVTQCGPPPGWVLYTVRSGDSLYRLSRELGVSIAQIQFANCMGGSTALRAGQRIYLPRIPVRLQTPTATPSLLPTVASTPTIEPTATFPPTLPPQPTGTFTSEPTSTEMPTPTQAPGDIITPTLSGAP